ncbi:hypothetical protein LHU53_15730 [Rhodoferax sp. U2-2l]|uniref:hypothetical protein n=1 Tax=Rhodoferax sp. U2-2l TaxID=2884000 RepID=UPI001D09E8A5|nr:hypothetical protein [Rhodoferax sp. U2-2l]MCB8748351.1 hypothetical protein [Rhodoferax sp. U2-2l]
MHDSSIEERAQPQRKTAKRVLQWAIPNALFGVALYFGVVEGVQGAANIAQFIIWFTFAISWVSLSDAFVRRVRAEGPSPIPASLGLSFDLAALALLLWYGWIFSAIALAVRTMLFLSIRHSAHHETNH